MKKLIAMLLALVMILSLCACDKKNSTEEELETAYLLTEISATQTDSEGKTHSMRGTVEYDDDYNVIGTKTYEDGKLSMETTYDKDMDKPLVEQEYDEDGKKTDRTEYTYDANGNRLERSGSYSYDGKTTTFKEVCTYDANGNQLTEKSYSNGELEYEYTYTYTAFNKVATQIRRDNDGDETHSTYTYDEHENVISCKTERKFADRDSYSYEEIYENTYEGDKLVEVKCYNDGTLEEYTKYDANGNEILRVYYFGDDGEESSRYETIYDANGNVLRRIEKWDEESNITTYTYNSKGNCIEAVETYGDEEKSRITYSYDDNGNCTGLKMVRDGNVQLEYTATYKEVKVSKEAAEKIAAFTKKVGIFNY